MRYAIISDIHGNQEALRSVLLHAKKRGIKDIVCLGDVVGYGPKPLECVQSVMENCEFCLKGNHDEGLVEGIYLFNPVAKRALEWTQELLRKTDHPEKDRMWDFLATLPLTYTVDEFFFVHGSPLDPTCDYILPRNVQVDRQKFRDIFRSFQRILFCGHTHMPCVITESLEVLMLDALNYKYHVGKEKAIVNVGSVGQPRDEDTRACYLEVIDDMFFFHRIEYDHELVCRQIEENERLDNLLAERLRKGK